MGSAIKDVFRAIADPTRREILLRLGEGPLTVGEICAVFDNMSQPSISAHLEVLRDTGLVEVRASGRHRIYSLVAEPLRQIQDWISHFETFWAEGLKRLGAALDEDAEGGNDVS